MLFLVTHRHSVLSEAEQNIVKYSSSYFTLISFKSSGNCSLEVKMCKDALLVGSGRRVSGEMQFFSLHNPFSDTKTWVLYKVQ